MGWSFVASHKLNEVKLHDSALRPSIDSVRQVLYTNGSHDSLSKLNGYHIRLVLPFDGSLLKIAGVWALYFTYLVYTQ